MLIFIEAELRNVNGSGEACLNTLYCLVGNTNSISDKGKRLLVLMRFVGNITMAVCEQEVIRFGKDITLDTCCFAV